MSNVNINEWNGYKKTEFTVGGRESYIVSPEKPLAGNPWVWRTEFFGAFDTVDRALLSKGWHLAYHRVSDMYGCPESIKMMKEFYDVAVSDFELNPRPALFGFSRGGLYASNFALEYPDCTGLLYLDAPVLEIRSWPGGKGKGVGAPDCWKECLECYKISENSVFPRQPIDRACEIAENGTPVLIICGDSDVVVPYDENSLIFYEKYRTVSDRIKMIVKDGCDHHPHSISDPSPAVDFIEKNIIR